MSDSINIGESAPLNYTKYGRQRVTVGISWDTPELLPDRPEAFNTQMDDDGNHYDVELDVKVGYVQEIYDLDLVCLIYDEDKDIIDAVSPSPQENVDMSGAIYHSGDDTAGVSAGDDEQISIEFAHVPDNIHHMVFLSIIQSGHTFEKVLNAEARIADGRSDKDQLKFLMGQGGGDGGDKTACVMVALSRDDEHDWTVKNIQQFRNDKEIEDWGDEAKQFLP